MTAEAAIACPEPPFGWWTLWTGWLAGSLSLALLFAAPLVLMPASHACHEACAPLPEPLMRRPVWRET